MVDLKSIGSGITGSMGGTASKIASMVVRGGIIVIMIIILAIIAVVVGLYVRYRSQFVYKVEIKSKRSSGVSKSEAYKIIEDKGAFIRNKKEGSVYFRLLNQKVDLTPPPLECMQIGIKGKNYIKIFQPSDEEYYYLMPDEIQLVNAVTTKGDNISVAMQKVRAIGGDSAYWNILRKRENRKLFDTEGLLMKLLPYIVPVLMFMLVIFLSYMITEHWGEFSAAATALKEAAEALSNAHSATVAVSPTPVVAPSP